MKSDKRAGVFLCILQLLTVSACGFPEWFPQSENTDVNGYIKELPFLVFTPGADEPDLNNLVHFRLNSRWYPREFITTEVAGRLQLYSGDQYSFTDSTLQLSTLLGRDRGYADLTGTWPSVLYGNIDRAWVSSLAGNLSIALGRQRINWGTNFIWNPNDWYNTFNFLDFDYEERPGTDALRIQYYTGVTSFAELVFEAGRKQTDRTFAALYKTNVWNYDFQVQGGLYELDASTGLSWAGQIGGAGFRGEAAYFHPVLNQKVDDFIGLDTSGTVVAAISADYVFSNSLYLHGEALYNGYGTRGTINLVSLAQQDLSAKNLLPSTFGLFAEVSYTFTPLLSGTIAGSVNPDDRSFYVAPALNWSVLENVDFFAIAQLFFGTGRTLYGDFSDLVALSLRWSFGTLI